MAGARKRRTARHQSAAGRVGAHPGRRGPGRARGAGAVLLRPCRRRRRALAHHTAHTHAVLSDAAGRPGAGVPRAERGGDRRMTQSDDTLVTVALHSVAHGRAGDKGNRLNVSVMPYDPAAYAVLAEQLTEKRVLALYAHRGATSV